VETKDLKIQFESLTATPLGLFDDKVVRDAKIKKISDWPDHLRFPLNFDGRKVESVVLDELKHSSNPLIITGFTSLDYLIDFVADLSVDKPEKISILLGSEPTPARRTHYRLEKKSLPQEVTDYWLEAGIALWLCHKVLVFIEMLKEKRVETRFIPDPNHKLHAKIFLGDSSASLGSSNFSFTGFRKQLEANARFDADKEPKRYRELKQIAVNYWSLGEGYNEQLIELLNQLLKVVSWEEALARACGELLEGDWAEQYIKSGNFGNGSELWPSQKVGIAQALWMVENVGSVLVADATGSGKTRMGTYLLRAIMDRIWSTGRARKDITVMVSPPNIVKDSWRKEAGACGLPLETLSHGIISRETSTDYNHTLNLIRRAQSLAIDEAHNFLNLQSSRTRSLLGNMADSMVMFTATPINKGVGDLLRIVDLLGADNLEDSALKLFERLEKRSRKNMNYFVTTREERLAMQREVQRFTLRRTKSMLNSMVEQQPDLYCDDRGHTCRYPKHIPKTYQTDESQRDQEIASKIRELAGELKGLVNLRSGIDIPDGLQDRIDDERYIRGRLQGARGLAIYNIMSRLRSSRSALIEHLLGTGEASKRYGIKTKIKAEDTGNVLGSLGDSAGIVHPSSIKDKLPRWLVDPDEHKNQVSDELKIYSKILVLVDELSDRRERAKASKLIELTHSHSLILAFDSCLITLEVLKNYIQQHCKCEVVVATGSNANNRKRVNKLFALGSDAKGVIALCSDAMSEGLNLQQASTVLLLDMPSVIRIAEQRVGRVDRMNSPHKEIEVWWPIDSDAFSLKTDRKFFRRYSEVRDILGSNIDLPEDLVPEEMAAGPSTVTEMVQKLDEIEREGENWDGLYDAFQPVRDLVDPVKGIVPVDVYDQLKKSKARVLSSISLVKSKKAWAFFAIAGVDRGAPKWIYLENLTSKPMSHLEEVATTLRRLLKGNVENRDMDEEASVLIDRFLRHILACEKQLLPRKKQRAIEEMVLIINHYQKLAKEAGEWDKIDWLDKLLGLVETSSYDSERPDLDSVAEAWLDLTRDVWYQKLIKRRRFKPLRLKDIRKDLQQNPFSLDQLKQAFSSIPHAQPLHSRVVSAIVGVPSSSR
jgi:superfamily II DNA or RNA helicase